MHDLRGRSAQYQHDLFDDFLPFLERYVVDPEYGGFLCAVRPNGERVSDEKRTWYEGRGVWVFAYLFNNICREQKYLDIAAASIELLKRSKPNDPDELRPKLLNRDGTPASDSDAEVYGDMFVAEGLAEFAKATGDGTLWDEARDLVFKCVRHYDRPDYHPSIGETYLGPGAQPFPGARIGGVWMVLIRTLSQMVSWRSDAALEALLNRSVTAFLDRHFNPRFRLFNELICHDLSRPRNQYERLVYAGHAIETLWMILCEARRRSDIRLFDTVAAHFRRHCEVARDRVYGGLFRNLIDVDGNIWTLDKTLFPHQEALIGSLLMIEETGDSWAMEFHAELEMYTRLRFPLRSLNSPLWQLTGDRQVTPATDMVRVENYHHPRFLMLSLQAIERMIERKGRPRRGA
ncbi:MAG TPA: AGE family epimerase/isomerase [Bryobacteraceae bacterium]|nr:AGE family epimerase/isomerase [Bryobacteraceae bacterium]